MNSPAHCTAHEYKLILCFFLHFCLEEYTVFIRLLFLAVYSGRYEKKYENNLLIGTAEQEKNWRIVAFWFSWKQVLICLFD